MANMLSKDNSVGGASKIIADIIPNIDTIATITESIIFFFRGCLFTKQLKNGVNNTANAESYSNKPKWPNPF